MTIDYEKYKEEVKTVAASVKEQLMYVIKKDNDDVVRRDVCAAMQNRLIALGTLLETELHLQDTEVIQSLEICCEACYQYAEKQIDLALFYSCMNYSLIYLYDAFVYSIPIGEAELSVSSIIKNERNIIEWIEYHRLVGVEHFYIYDNESTDGLRDKLEKYIEDGIVTYTFFPGKYRQNDAANYSIEHFKLRTRWLAIIDGDEYLIPMEENKKLPQILNEIRTGYMDHPMRMMTSVGGIGVNWRCYGTSGHKTKVDGLIIENYQYRAEDDYFQNAHIKSVINPRVTVLVDNPHYANYEDGYGCISEKGSFIPYSYFYDSRCTKLRINHYFSKSEEELLSKNKRGWPDRDLQRDDNKELYEATVNCNKIFDPVMDRYIEKMKMVMD